VRTRIAYLAARGRRTFTTSDFPGVARHAGRPGAWLEDHLLVLEGIGILQPVRRPGPRTWRVSPGSEYLR
jgi:hypothetical protein